MKRGGAKWLLRMHTPTCFANNFESTTGADASVKVQDMKLLDLASLAT